MTPFLQFSFLSVIQFVSIALTAQCAPDQVLSNQIAVDSYNNCIAQNGSLIIEGQGITNLNALSALESIQGDLFINNTNLTNLDGLDNLKDVGRLFIVYNTSLVDISALNQIEYLNDIEIRENDALSAINGLDNITFTTGGVLVSYNPSLTSFDALNNLSGLYALLIYNNSSLASIEGFDLLEEVEFLELENNNSLGNLDFLSNLISVNGLSIFNNFSLDNINGLSSLTSVGQLAVQANASLTSCAIEVICDKIINDPQNVVIEDNAGDCEDESTLLSKCLLPVETLFQNTLQVYPNPSRGILQFDLPHIVRKGTLIIYDLNGAQLITKTFSDQFIEVSLNLLPKGMYFYSVINEDLFWNGKIIFE